MSALVRGTRAWTGVAACLAGACVAGCAAGGGSHPAAEPAWQQQMEAARRLAAEGSSYTLVAPDGVYAFYNEPRPFCYAYSIPGAWVSGPEPGLYRAKHGDGLAGVVFLLAEELEGVAGANLVERAANAATREYESRIGRPLAGVELAPFACARPGAKRWRAAPVIEEGRSLAFPTKVFVALGPEAVALITVEGSGDDDALARRIVESLHTTRDPPCYWPALEELLRAALGDR